MWGKATEGSPVRSYAPLSRETEQVAAVVVDASFRVHLELGPGLLEGVYETCLAKELELRGMRVERQLVLPVTYRGQELEAAYRVDLLVDRQVIVEVKAVDALLPLHSSQLLTYLRFSGLRLGFLVNFHVAAIRLGIRRYVI